MISFEYNHNQERIAIILDQSGAKTLIKELENLIKANVNDHTHLMSKEWGGSDLDIIMDKQSDNDISVNHVVIYYGNDYPFL